jgi:exopolysaccharide biosynthesis polyprenyl glycosylphosphotransferase
MSDSAIAPEGAEELASGGHRPHDAANGQPARSLSAEPVLMPVPAPEQKAAPLRRWTPAAVVTDVAMLAIANAIFMASDPGQPSFWLPLLLVFDAITLGLISSWRGYAPRLRLDALDDLRMTVTSTAVATMTVISIDALVHTGEPSSYVGLRLWFLATTLLTVGRLSSSLVTTWRREHSHAAATTIIVGAGQVGRLTANRLLEHPEFGLRPIGFLDPEPMEISGKPLPLPVLGTSASLAQVVSTNEVECAVVAFSTDSHDALLAVLDQCTQLGIRTLVVPRLFERVPSRLQVTHVGGLPLLEMLGTSPLSIQFAVKYALDRIAAALLLVALSPLLLVVATVVAASMGRPILYRQERLSLDGRRFSMLKFRTMQHVTGGAESEAPFDPQVAPGGVEGTDRRTRVGAFLRIWSLDELPQLVNVVRGEMSLVGPRPERPEYVEYFRAHVRRYDGRLRTKAGITGWAQIHRLRGQTSITDRVEWDNYYIENFSLWLDFKILLRTIPEALKGRAN